MCEQKVFRCGRGGIFSHPRCLHENEVRRMNRGRYRLAHLGQGDPKSRGERFTLWRHGGTLSLPDPNWGLGRLPRARHGITRKFLTPPAVARQGCSLSIPDGAHRGQKSVTESFTPDKRHFKAPSRHFRATIRGGRKYHPCRAMLHGVNCSLPAAINEWA